MKIFEQNDIRTIDAETIRREGITSDALMERAAKTVSDWVLQNVDSERKIVIVAGPGNNGGDGLVVARHLALCFDVTLYAFTGTNGKRSADNALNADRLKNSRVQYLENPHDIEFPQGCLIIDALFGTGLSRPVEGELANVIHQINNSGCEVLSIDLPSGLGNEDSLKHLDHYIIVKATHTIAFQMPKIAFFMPEAEQFVGNVTITDIGLNGEAIAEKTTRFFFTEKSDITPKIRLRSRFAHKGDMGRAMIFAGSYGMMGAAQLSAKACLRSGVGLLTMAIPQCGYEIMQIGVPEAMVVTNGKASLEWTDKMYDTRLKAIAIGPGIGRDEQTTSFVSHILYIYNSTPKVIDADGLWYLSKIRRSGEKPSLENAILTPHDAEFDNLTTPHLTRKDRLDDASLFASDNKCIVVLKGANTAICLPDGTIHFNSTGNPGMATAGSGDVLTGIITALLAQGYSTTDAAIIGVFNHGAAGDRARDVHGEQALIASDIIAEL